MYGSADYITTRMPFMAFIKSLFSFIVISIILGIGFWILSMGIGAVTGSGSGPVIVVIGIIYALAGMYLPLSHVYERGWEDAKQPSPTAY